MPVHPVERKLAAIFAADIAGYSRLMACDEVGTLGRLKACRAIIDKMITSHRGRIFNTAGDSVVADFASAVDAVQCAVAVQAAITMENAASSADEPMQFRIGVHVGDVMVDGENLLGDGVNIAARLESLAEPGTICVSAVARDQVGNRLPLAFADLGDQHVKNIPQAIRVYRVRTEVPAAQPVAALPLPDKPSIAVLPFQNMSGDPEQEYFADGIVEEITTAIACFPWLFVIARNSSFTYKGKAVDVRQVARELGVRYVLEGSVRKGGHRVRITGQLIDAATGAHIWADRFDGALDDVFELQDRVASSVAGAIEPRLRLSEIERTARKPTENLGAYDLYLRAVGAMYKDPISPASIEFAQRALAAQPDYAPAAAIIAGIRSNQFILARVSLTDAEIAEALDFARAAAKANSEDADTLARGAYALAFLGGEHATAMRAIERALTLNPSCAYAWGIAARVHCLANRSDPAIAASERAMRLSPLDPFHYSFEWTLGWALMLAGRYEEAVGWVDQCLHDRPDYQSGIRGRIALCGYLGQVEEARKWVKRLKPAMTIAEFNTYMSRFTSAGTLAVWVEGFRLAGLPET